MSSVILLSGIRVSGRHGVDPEERMEAQEFVVDLEVTVAVDDDDLENTADYRALAQAARDVVETQSFSLLETLADAVARAAFEFESVEEVTAVVHKPRAANSMGADDVSATSTVR
jgi:7,8-dihydroneopterin aldolase/epimerase/oxygenase